MQPAQAKNKTPGQRIAPLTTDRSVSVLFLSGCNWEPMDVGAFDPRKTALFIARSFLLQAIPSHSFLLSSGPSVITIKGLPRTVQGSIGLLRFATCTSAIYFERPRSPNILMRPPGQMSSYGILGTLVSEADHATEPSERQSRKTY
jgi:hypothetical protein